MDDFQFDRAAPGVIHMRDHAEVLYMVTSDLAWTPDTVFFPYKHHISD